MENLQTHNEVNKAENEFSTVLPRSQAHTYPSNLTHCPAVRFHSLCSFMRYPCTCLNMSEEAVKKKYQSKWQMFT